MKTLTNCALVSLAKGKANSALNKLEKGLDILKKMKKQDT
jgi:hypothetical protein